MAALAVMRVIQKILLASFLSLASLTVARAGEVDVQSDGSVTWDAGVDGVSLECIPDGSFKRLYSRADHPVNFPDRAGIAKAQAIAEAEAKAHIVSFLKQQVTTGQFTAQVDNDVSKSTRDIQDGKEAISKSTARTIVENVSKVTSSVAQGTLMGVVTLERGYDEKKEVAWVVVGISAKSIAAAKGLKDTLNGSTGRPAMGDSRRTDDTTSFPRQPSELQRSRTDW